MYMQVIYTRSFESVRELHQKEDVSCKIQINVLRVILYTALVEYAQNFLKVMRLKCFQKFYKNFTYHAVKSCTIHVVTVLLEIYTMQSGHWEREATAAFVKSPATSKKH